MEARVVEIIRDALVDSPDTSLVSYEAHRVADQVVAHLNLAGFEIREKGK